MAKQKIKIVKSTARKSQTKARGNQKRCKTCGRFM